MSDLDALAARIAKRLIARRETIAVSESSAGGLISSALLALSPTCMKAPSMSVQIIAATTFCPARRIRERVGKAWTGRAWPGSPNGWPHAQDHRPCRRRRLASAT